MNIQYKVPGFELTTFGTRVSSHNHWRTTWNKPLEKLENVS